MTTIVLDNELLVYQIITFWFSVFNLESIVNKVTFFSQDSVLNLNLQTRSSFSGIYDINCNLCSCISSKSSALLSLIMDKYDNAGKMFYHTFGTVATKFAIT